MADARRVEKVDILLREVIAAILERDVVFAPGSLVTVTRVAATEDLYYATVYVSVLGPAAAEQEAMEQLSRETAAVQYTLNRKLRMRPVPRITFAIDQQEKRRERIEKLLSDSEGKD